MEPSEWATAKHHVDASTTTADVKAVNKHDL